MTALLAYLPLLALDFAIEAPLAQLLARGIPGVWRIALLLNLLTHPLATAWMLSGGSFAPIQLAVLGTEVLGYRLAGGLSWRLALVVGLVCNGVSGGISLLLV